MGIDWTQRIETTPPGRTFYSIEPFAATAMANQEISELFI